MTASRIEWTGRSDWNPLRGCTRVSEGCRNCYAEAIAGRFSDPGQAFHGFAERTPKGARWTGRVALVEERLTLPLRWRKPAVIFASSTSDIFHESLADADIDRIFAVMALAPQHTFQVLTKRAERMRAYLTDDRWPAWAAAADRIDRGSLAPFRQPGTIALPNVWLGVSIEDQAAADARIPHLLATPAALRFLSCEPLLGPVDLAEVPAEPSGTSRRLFGPLSGYCIQHHPVRRCGCARQQPAIDWVIAGGESGRGARPMHPDWARSLRDQCADAGVPFFFKQWGEWGPVSDIDIDAIYDKLYFPAPANNPEASRRCRVDQCVLHAEGTRFAKHEWQKEIGGERLLAFQAGLRGITIFRVGKREAGRRLDGVEHDGMPA